ncbi:MAG: type II toxin-antitoxin system HipA family toxin [Proteobacteria bacterium]|nr:type II toxin-antitoxin system HipA family toxin [Pseudomonadota bacterium]
MKINAKGRIQHIDIKVAGQPAGSLNKNSQFEFTYHSDASNSISVTMPLSTRHYQSGSLFPIFEMNIPEGYVRYRITERLRKRIKVDDMLFLSLQGAGGIGCLSYETPDIEQEEVAGEKLSEILAWQGKDDLFEELINKYLLHSTLSGVQPKVLVPEYNDKQKGAFVLPSLIVKTSDENYPELAINEYICMSLAKACQIETPEFWLSDNHQMFVMRRFDLTAEGHCIGMEDMAVLQGKSTDHKYQGSYESIGKALNLYSSTPKEDIETFFKMVVLSCMVGNGDGHLKNFAMLYNDPDDMRLSPLYDVVNTQIYVPNDTLALNLAKSKDFPDRRRIITFSESLEIKNGDNLLDELEVQVRDELDKLSDYTKLMSHDIKASILKNLHLVTTRTAIKTRTARKHTKHKN